MQKRIAILTGGGDCPGINPVIRAIVRKAVRHNYHVIGIKNGWKGLIEKNVVSLDLGSVSGILVKGGTILGTSRTNPFKNKEDAEIGINNFKALEIEALIAIGGEDTLGVASKFSQQGLNIVGVPKTIDNDLSGTDRTFGFDTAVNIATEAIDRIHTTAESHHRVMVVEVMGRHSGWIGLEAGLAGGADIILIPEFPIDLDEICATIKKRHERGKTFSIVVVAEGAKFKEGTEVLQDKEKDAFGHVRLGGIGQVLCEEIQKRTWFETRVTVLGHIQRGGTPTAYDRVLGTRYGIKAMQMVLDKEFGKMASLCGTEIVSVPLEKAVGEVKTVPPELYEMAKVFFG
ncbi:MAG: 6-phosphofructokinase [Candidatus Omnitrophica bacterium]|nr:6-phosphofructokinase [Candidatus Omnitrophota bacterium]